MYLFFYLTTSTLESVRCLVIKCGQIGSPNSKLQHHTLQKLLNLKTEDWPISSGRKVLYYIMSTFLPTLVYFKDPLIKMSAPPNPSIYPSVQGYLGCPVKELSVAHRPTSWNLIQGDHCFENLSLNQKQSITGEFSHSRKLAIPATTQQLYWKLTL